MSMRPVECGACGNEVLVEKRSLPHTTVQWTRPTDRCPELAGRDSALTAVCTGLRSSIERAVREGTLEVGTDAEPADGE
ncbi:hypothetical protein [Streptomyces iconiensis]|uniref:Ferredoxin n=1 Tax=Streptomyces iconiensis TaxID=1384038 RepID=A0ABT7A2G1_9ACTN|nr:hypothetical protein [Streptomyces iconiensis]MDJ1135510.1 hypothetical protein [Streptomyces iconiensis]